MGPSFALRSFRRVRSSPWPCPGWSVCNVRNVRNVRSVCKQPQPCKHYYKVRPDTSYRGNRDIVGSCYLSRFVCCLSSRRDVACLSLVPRHSAVVQLVISLKTDPPLPHLTCRQTGLSQAVAQTLSMPLTLSQATAADIPALTDIYMLAFQDPITVACFPRTPNVRRWWDSRNTEAFMGDPATRFIKVNDGDRIVAYAKWNVPVRADEPGAASRSSSSSSNPDALPLWPDDANKALCDRFFSELRDKRKEVMRDRPHYCRSCIVHNCLSPRRNGWLTSVSKTWRRWLHFWSIETATQPVS